MIEVDNTDVNIVRNLIPMRNLMPASAYGLKAISDWFGLILTAFEFSRLNQNSKILPWYRGMHRGLPPRKPRFKSR